MKLRERVTGRPEGVPVELADRDADVWHDQDDYLGYMDLNGYRLPAGERLASESSPQRRRGAAVEGWALQAGVEQRGHPGFPDWRRLREMGLT